MTYNGVAGGEDVTQYDAALFLGPRLSVWLFCAGVANALSIRAAWQILPAVSKHQWADYHCMAPCSEVVICIVVIVATQPTHTTLKKSSFYHVVKHQNKGHHFFPIKITILIHILQDYLIFLAELDEQAGLPIPHENKSIVGFDYQVVAHSAVMEWGYFFLST